jgi:hypothetical protein
MAIKFEWRNYIMATIIKRGNTISVVFYLGKGENRTQIWETMPNIATAKKRAQFIKKGKSNGTLTSENYVSPTKLDLLKVSNGCPTLREYIEFDFIPKYGMRTWGHSYYRSTKSKFENYIYPMLGDTFLYDFTPLMIDDYYNYLLTTCVPVEDSKKRGLTKNIVNDIHKVLAVHLIKQRNGR